jgi:hypothetical protein
MKKAIHINRMAEIIMIVLVCLSYWVCH